MGKQTEGGRASEAVSLWGCKQRKECGFHGNLRKAELWVSVPALTALHCTGPRLSVGSFLPSSPTLFIFLSLSLLLPLYLCFSPSLHCTLYTRFSLLMCGKRHTTFAMQHHPASPSFSHQHNVIWVSTIR